MSGGGIIVRLIDIVLLLLMGFIAISKIEEKSSVRLPQSNLKLKILPQKEEVIIVGIYRDRKERQILRYSIESAQKSMPNFESIKSYILERKKYYESHKRKIKVRIRSDWNLSISYAMKVAKFCQRNGIQVGIDVESK